MTPFTSITGPAVPILDDDLNTDQISQFQDRNQPPTSRLTQLGAAGTNSVEHRHLRSDQWTAHSRNEWSD